MITAPKKHHIQEESPVSENRNAPPKGAITPTFLDLLAGAEDGRLVQHLTDKMKELAVALRSISERQGGKPKGKLLLSIELKLDGGIFEMIGAVAVRKPEPARARSILYDTKDGGLSIDNPRQLSMAFAKDATPQAADLRVV